MNMRKGAKPAPGKFAPNHAISVTMYDLPAMYNERSKFICGLKADSPALNAAVDKMVSADNLYQPGKNPADTLTSVQKGFSPNAMQEGAKEMLKQAQPKQNQPQNLLNGQPVAGQNNIINGMPDGPIM